MSLGSSDKELTSTFKRLSVTNELTPINNKNNITILTQNVFDAIDFKRLKKRADLASISDYIEKMGVLEADKKNIEKAISELVKLNLITNKKTSHGLNSFCRTF